MAKNSLALPDHVVQLLAAADARNGLPAGTMFSVMQQEIGGQNRFLDDPTLPHYPTGVAPNGKKSSAFGPFGILESTGRDPGYGVAPLKDKSLQEQIRFASDYLAGRTRAAGGDLSKGLAGYGEGAVYAQQVASRMPTQAQAATPTPVVEPASQAAPPVVVADAQPALPVAPAVQPGPVIPAPADPEKDPWTQLQRQVAASTAERFKPTDMQYGGDKPVKVKAPEIPTGPEDYQALLAMDIANRPSFGAFQGLVRLGRRPA